MKENKQTNMKGLKHILVLSGAFLLTFGLSAGGVFLLLPQKTIVNTIGNQNGTETELTNSQKFVNRLIETATSGITLDVDDLEFVIPGAVKTVSGQEVRTENRIENIEGKNPRISLALDEISLQGISLCAELPLQYNGLKRELNLGLLGDGETSKNLYFNIGDIDGDEGDWTAGYQVDVSRYVTEEIDPVTGGTMCYEYGALDFVIHDILEILTEGGINVDTYGKIESLITGESSSSSSSEPAASEETSSSSSIDADALLDALNTIVETNIAGQTYFTLDLPLGDTNLSIGLGADENLNLSHVDIPSKTSGLVSQTINTDWTLVLSADVKTAASGETYDWTVPAAWQAYPHLDDSLDLFRRVASLVATPKFGLRLDVDMIHREDAKAGTLTTFSKNGVEERALLSLSGDVDLSWKFDNGNIKGVNFNSAAASLSFEKMNKTESGWERGSNKQMLDAYIDNSGSDNASVYLNVMDVLKARTTKTVLDEMVGKFKDEASSSTDPVETVEEEKTTAQLDEIVDTVTNVIGTLRGEEDFDTPSLLAGLKEKHYESILEMIESVQIEDNLIAISLSLKGLGFPEARIVVRLDGNSEHSLASVEIQNLVLNTMTLNLTLATEPFEALPGEELLAMNAWSEMNRLPTLVDPIAKIVKDKKASIGIEGSVSKRGTMDVYGDPLKTQGMDIQGTVNLDFSKAKGENADNPFLVTGGVDLALLEKAETYYQDHHVKLDIANAEDEFANAANQVYFHYDSLNDGGEAIENRDDPDNLEGLNGKIHLSSAADALSPMIDAISGADDRFGRISRLLSSPAEATLLSDLTSGNYFSALTYDVLKSASIGGDVDSFVIDGSCFGMDGDIALSLAFEEAGLKNIGVDLALGEDPLTATDVNLALSFGEITESTPFSFLDHEASYTDFTGLASLGDYAVSTALLGLENGTGVSTYDLQGDVSIALGDYEAKIASASLQASVEGAKTMVHASLNDIPVIRGINAPDDPRYFRELEIGGQRDASFYYYSDGREDAEGNLVSELLMTRHSDYGRLANVNDSVKLDKEGAFKDDALNYLLQYFLGVNESFFEDSEPAPAEETGAATERAIAIHVEDLFGGFAKSFDEETGLASWEIRLNLNPLLGVNVLDDIVLRLEGGSFGGFHALNAIHVGAGVSLESDQGTRMNILSANIDLKLLNLRNGEYLDGWTKGQEAFEQNFIRFLDESTYEEVGIYAEPTEAEGGPAWRHGVDEVNKGHRNYYLGLSA